MSTRIGSPETGLPSGPIAATFTEACEPPSCVMLSGVAVTFSVSASCDGPVSGGTSVL